MLFREPLRKRSGVLVAKVCTAAASGMKGSAVFNAEEDLLRNWRMKGGDKLCRIEKKVREISMVSRSAKKICKQQ